MVLQIISESIESCIHWLTPRLAFYKYDWDNISYKEGSMYINRIIQYHQLYAPVAYQTYNLGDSIHIILA